jgi:hypothetical protein
MWQKKILTESALAPAEITEAKSLHKQLEDTYCRQDVYWKFMLILDPSHLLDSYDNLNERNAYTQEAVSE